MTGKAKLIVENTINGAIISTYENEKLDGSSHLCEGVPVRKSYFIAHQSEIRTRVNQILDQWFEQDNFQEKTTEVR